MSLYFQCSLGRKDTPIKSSQYGISCTGSKSVIEISVPIAWITGLFKYAPKIQPGKEQK